MSSSSPISVWDDDDGDSPVLISQRTPAGGGGRKNNEATAAKNLTSLTGSTAGVTDGSGRSSAAAASCSSSSKAGRPVTRNATTDYYSQQIDFVKARCKSMTYEKNTPKRTAEQANILRELFGDTNTRSALDWAQSYPNSRYDWSRLIGDLSGAVQKELTGNLDSRMKWKNGKTKTFAPKMSCFAAWEAGIKALLDDADRSRKSGSINLLLENLRSFLADEEAKEVYMEKVFGFLSQIRNRLLPHLVTDPAVCFGLMDDIVPVMMVNKGKCRDATEIVGMLAVRYLDLHEPENKETKENPYKAVKMLTRLLAKWGRDCVLSLHLIVAFNAIMAKKGFAWRNFLIAEADSVAGYFSSIFDLEHAPPEATLKEGATFFKQLLILHHPGNLSDPDLGAMLSEGWNYLLSSICSGVVSLFEAKLLKDTGSRRITPDVVEVFSRALIQVINQCGTVEINSKLNSSLTQLHSERRGSKRLSHAPVCSGPPEKKRKLELTWSSLLDLIRSSCWACDRKTNRPTACHPWIQVMKWMFVHAADSISEDGFQILLDGCMSLVLAVKRPETVQLLTDCLAGLSKVSAVTRREQVFRTLEKQKVLDWAVRMAHSRKLQTGIYWMISQLLRAGFLSESRVKQVGDTLRATLPHSELCHPESLNVLLSYLACSDFPERIPLSGMDETSSDSPCPKWRFRMSVLRWILDGAQSCYSIEQVVGLPLSGSFYSCLRERVLQIRSNRPLLTTGNSFPGLVENILVPECLSFLLFLLCQKEPAGFLEISVLRNPPHAKEPVLEDFLLETLFLKPPPEQLSVSTPKLPVPKCQFLPEIFDLVLFKCKSCLEEFLECFPDEIIEDGLFYLLFHWCFLWCSKSFLWTKESGKQIEPVHERLSEELCSAVCTRLDQEEGSIDVSVVLDRLCECGHFLSSSGLGVASVSQKIIEMMENLCVRAAATGKVRVTAARFLALVAPDENEITRIVSNVMDGNAEINLKVDLIWAFAEGITYSVRRTVREVGSVVLIQRLKESLGHIHSLHIVEIVKTVKELWKHLDKKGEELALKILSTIIRKWNVFECGGQVELTKCLITVLAEKPETATVVLYEKPGGVHYTVEDAYRFCFTGRFGFPSSFLAVRALDRCRISLSQLKTEWCHVNRRLNIVLERTMGQHVEPKDVDKVSNGKCLLLNIFGHGLSRQVDSVLHFMEEMAKLMFFSVLDTSVIHRMFSRFRVHDTVRSSLNWILNMWPHLGFGVSYEELPFDLFTSGSSEEFIRENCTSMVAAIVCKKCGVEEIPSWLEDSTGIPSSQLKNRSIPRIFLLCDEDPFELLSSVGFVDVLGAVREHTPLILAYLLDGISISGIDAKFGTIGKDEFFKRVDLIVQRFQSADVTDLLRTRSQDSIFEFVHGYLCLKNGLSEPSSSLEKLKIIVEMLNFKNMTPSAAEFVLFQLLTEFKFQLGKLLSERREPELIMKSIQNLQCWRGVSMVSPNLLANCWNLYLEESVGLAEARKRAKEALASIYADAGSPSFLGIRIPVKAPDTTELRKAWMEMRKRIGGGSFSKEMAIMGLEDSDLTVISSDYLDYLNSLPPEFEGETKKIPFFGVMDALQKLWLCPDLRFGLSKLISRLDFALGFDAREQIQVVSSVRPMELTESIARGLLEVFLFPNSYKMQSCAADCARRFLEVGDKEYLLNNSVGWLSIFADSYKKVKGSVDFGDESLIEEITNISMDLEIDFEAWIKSACGSLCMRAGQRKGEKMFRAVAPLCFENEFFAMRLFPYCIADLVLTEAYLAQLIGSQFDQLIEKILGKVVSMEVEGDKNGLVGCRLVCVALMKVLYQIQVCEEDIRGVRRYNLITVCYKALAKLAEKLGLSYPAIYFSEVAMDPIRTGKGDASLISEGPIERMTELVPETDLNWFIDTQLNAFISLNDTDRVYSLGELALSTDQARQFLAENEKQWGKLIALYSSTKLKDDTKLESVLYSAAIGDPSQFSEDFQYECAWKLGKWDDLDVPKLEVASFNRALFGAVHSVSTTSGTDSFSRNLEALRKCVIESTPLLGLLLDDSRRKLQKIHVLSHFEFALQQFTSARSVASFCKKVSNLGLDLEEKAGLRTAVVSFLLALADSDVSSFDKEVVVSTLSKLVSYQAASLRNAGMCQRSLLLLDDWRKSVEEMGGNFDVYARNCHVLEEVKTLWSAKESELAKNKLRLMIGTLKMETERTIETKMLLSRSLCLLAEFHSEISGSKTESSVALYGQALAEIDNGKSELQPLLGHTLSVLADYTYQRFRTLKEYFSSEKMEGMAQRVESWKREKAILQTTLDLRAMPVYLYGTMLRCHQEYTEQELRQLHAEKKELMIQSVKLLFRCLELCNERDLEVFTIISVWFENIDDTDLAKLVSEFGGKVATHKWLVAWSQLTSRLTSNLKHQHKDALEKLVNKVCTDHPFHSFYTIFSLSKGVAQPGDARSSARIEAAKKMLISLRSGAKAGVIREMFRLAESYLQFAKLDRTILKDLRGKYPFDGVKFSDLRKKYNDKFLSTSKSTGGPIPEKFKLFHHRNSRIPTPSFALPIDKTCEYRNIVTSMGFVNEFEICDGQNCPRVVKCLCSDGVTRKQLVKGFDDTRQDAVMEQVFGVVNQLLLRQKQLETIRTYSIVPLSSEGGVLQWCEGTIPLTDYLTGADRVSGAHKSYYPQDWTGKKGLMQMKNATTRAQRIINFKECLKNIRPALRHFFFENYPDPVQWFHRRKAYTRSVAVASMVGHILGLGDRHFSNILIDKESAEVVHIDLGIAFEQGKNLALPELVPFRLTRDVVDPMGVCGVEGDFRRCCKSSLQVLRDSMDIIVTIVSVLLEDPLSQWELTDLKREKAQPVGKNPGSASVSQSDTDGTKRNEHAVRVIERVKEKLKGIESEKAEILTAERQVGFLIDEARSFDNLAQIYGGWAAFL